MAQCRRNAYPLAGAASIRASIHEPEYPRHEPNALVGNRLSQRVDSRAPEHGALSHCAQSWCTWPWGSRGLGLCSLGNSGAYAALFAAISAAGSSASVGPGRQTQPAPPRLRKTAGGGLQVSMEKKSRPLHIPFVSCPEAVAAHTYQSVVPPREGGEGGEAHRGRRCKRGRPPGGRRRSARS